MPTLLDTLTHSIVAPEVKRRWFSKPSLPFRRYLGLYQQALEMGVGIGYSHQDRLPWLTQFYAINGSVEKLVETMQEIARKHLSELPNAFTLYELGAQYEEARCRKVTAVSMMSRMSLDESSKWAFSQENIATNQKRWDRWADKHEILVSDAHGNIGFALCLGIALGGTYPEKTKR